MNKKLKNYFFAITFLITAVQYIENVYSTTDFNNDKDYLTITDISESEVDDTENYDNWISAQANVIPSEDMTNSYSFDLFYTIYGKDKNSDISLHITGYEYPLVTQTVTILYNKNKFRDILLIDSNSRLTVKTL